MGGCHNSSNERRKLRHQSNQESHGSDTKKNENASNIYEKKINESKNNNNNNELTNSNLKEIQSNPELNIYLICPNCSQRSPHIEKIYYDDKSEDFLVKYTCICFDDPMAPKKAKFMNILSNKEPLNTCNLHQDNKLVSFCNDCHKAICNKCKEENHNEHNLEDNINNNITKEDADNMLNLIKQKEEKFNIEINQNEQKMENGIDNMIQKLNMEKQNYKKQLENYKDNNQKTFDFLKNLYGRYINNFEKENNNNLSKNDSMVNHDNNINNDIMLTNHINKFTIDKNMPNLNSNVDEIINQFNDEQKELKLKFDYGFPSVIRNSTESYQDNEMNKSNENINSRKITKNSQIYKQNISQSKNNVSFDTKELSCVKTFEGHTEKIVSLIELSSGELASGSYDNTIRIWNINNGNTEKIINEDGRVFALLEFEKNKLLSGTSNNTINLWDLNSSNDKCLYSFNGHELWINCLVKCNENYFASASNDSKIKIWDYYKRKLLKTLNGHIDCILSLIILRNNYLCSGSADLTIKIWDWEKGDCKNTLKGHEKWVKSVFELDNGIIVSGSDDKTIKLWNNYECFLTLDAHKHSVRTFCQINKKYFASGSFDCTIKIWEINTWKCVQTLDGHKSNLICVIVLNNKKDDNCNSIASCSNDRTIKIWEGNL